MNKLLLLIGLVIFLNSINLFAKEKDEKPIDIEDIIKLGSYIPIEEFPEKIIAKFGLCSNVTCRAKIAGQQVHHRFVVKKKSMGKYPGKVMKAMAWYEILYYSNLKKTEIFIKRYLLNEGQDYKAKEIDEMKIRTLMSMNKGRESMRKSLGMNLDTPVQEAIKNFWVLGEFLDQGKPKEREVDQALLERKEIIKKYKAKVSAILNKIEENKEEKKVANNEVEESKKEE